MLVACWQCFSHGLGICNRLGYREPQQPLPQPPMSQGQAHVDLCLCVRIGVLTYLTVPIPLDRFPLRECVFCIIGFCTLPWNASVLACLLHETMSQYILEVARPVESRKACALPEPLLGSRVHLLGSSQGLVRTSSQALAIHSPSSEPKTLRVPSSPKGSSLPSTWIGVRTLTF